MTKALRCLGLAAALATATASSPAQDAPNNPQTLRARSLAATCAACHGTDGRATAGAALPGLAAMPATYLVEQMKSFRSGARPGTVMPQLAKGYSDAQIEQLGAWFSQVPANASRK